MRLFDSENRKKQLQKQCRERNFTTRLLPSLSFAILRRFGKILALSGVDNKRSDVSAAGDSDERPYNDYEDTNTSHYCA
jgi:hypothetical protein